MKRTTGDDTNRRHHGTMGITRITRITSGPNDVLVVWASGIFFFSISFFITTFKLACHDHNTTRQ